MGGGRKKQQIELLSPRGRGRERGVTGSPFVISLFLIIFEFFVFY